MTILVTGANGFLGRALTRKLLSNGSHVVGTVRQRGIDVSTDATEELQCFKAVGEINASTDWTDILQDVECVVHCAARVHIMNDNDGALEAFRKVNVEGTLALAKAAASAGIRRFIFVSSIKVNGEATDPGVRFLYSDAPAPEDAYGQSKMEAEAGLWEIAQKTDLEIVILRPPLVYGPGVKANFSSLMKLATRNLPLPLGSIQNKRSMVALENLVSLIVICISHPKAANQTFLVSDDHDISTTELLELMVRAVGKKPRLLPVPMRWLIFGATVLGKKAIADRLCGSLQVDISHTKETLGWVPPISLEEGIQRCFQQG